MGMPTIYNRVFENERIRVDGTAYEGCKFRFCRIIFSATEPVSFIDCNFKDCDWVFDGPAETALTYLSALYRGLGAGGQQLVEMIFDLIREGKIGEIPVDAVHEMSPLVRR